MLLADHSTGWMKALRERGGPRVSAPAGGASGLPSFVHPSCQSCEGLRGRSSGAAFMRASLRLARCRKECVS